MGLNKIKFDKLEIGPILFYEQMYYYKEIKIGVKFSVTVEIDGYSEDGKFFKLFQNFFFIEGPISANWPHNGRRQGRRSRG